MHLFHKRPKSTFWWFEYRRRYGPDVGKKIKRSTGIIHIPDNEPGATEARREALEAAEKSRVEIDAADLAAERARGGSPPNAAAAPPLPVVRIQLVELRDMDLARARAKGVSDKQLRSLTDQWDNHLLRLLGADTDASTIDYDTLIAYIGQRRQEPGKGGAQARGQSIRRERQALFRGLANLRRMLLKRGVSYDLPDAPEIQDDPTHKAQQGKFHEPHILAQWLKALSELEEEDERIRGAVAQAQAALFCGLRAEELDRFTLEWLQPASSELQRTTGCDFVIMLPEECVKDRDDRIVGIPEFVARDIVELWRPGMALSERILSGNHRRSFAHAARRISYRRSPTLRDLRHTFCTLSLQYGGDLRATQEAMGHRELQSTQRYLSSTASRTVAAGLVVEQVFAPTLPPPGPEFDPQTQPPPPAGMPVGAEESQSRGERIRTSGFLLPKQDTTLQRHLSECSYCQVVVAECIDSHADAPPPAHRSAHSRPQNQDLG